MGEHLLLLAAGGHRDVTTALADIESSYYELTQEPLVEGDRKRLRGRRLEETEADIAALEERLAQSRRAQSLGTPIIREQRALNLERTTCINEIERLEAALPVLVQRRSLKEQRSRLTDRIVRLEALQRDVAGAELWVESSQRAWALFSDQAQLPDDFRERTAALQELWPRRAQCQTELQTREAELAGIQVPPLAVAISTSVTAVLAGGALVFIGQLEIGVGAAGIGILAAVGFGLWRRSVGQRWQAAIAAVEDAARNLKELDDRIQRKKRNMPDAATLGPETLADRQLRFETERKARHAKDDAKRRLADTLVRAVDELYGEGGEAIGDAAEILSADEALEARKEALSILDEGASADVLAEHGKRTLARVGRALVDDRNALASKVLELRRVLAGPAGLAGRRAGGGGRG